MNKFFYIINILKHSFFLNLNNKALSFLKKILIILKINLLIITSFTSSAQAQVISESTSSTVTINSNEDFVVNSGVTLSNTTSTANAGSSGSSIVLNNFTNNGTMQGSDTGGNIMSAFNSSVKTTFINNGVMRGKGGINFYSSVDLTNNASKSIQGTDRAIHLRSGSTGTDLTNNGTIQGNYSSIRVYSGVTINSLTNGSTGTIGPGIFGLELYGTITTLTNNGTIRNNQNSHAAIRGSSATITTLKNYGTIRNNNSSISISGTTVTNLYNSQSNFKFSGNLPSNYYIFIDGSNTGKITFSDFGSTSLVFAIDPSSTLSAGTYSAVVNGISSSNISSGTSGTFGGKNWALNNSSGTQWDLVVTVPDTTAPTLSSSSPADNATAVDVNANIVLNFDESVDVESGDITIKKTSDDSTVETIDVTGAKVSGSGSSQITVNPSSTLDSLTEYYVLIDATAFDDSSSNSFAGISSTTALSFTTNSCPLGSNDQTVDIASGDSCTTRVSNPNTAVSVAGSLIVSSGDGALYWNNGNHTVNITGTVRNSRAGTTHGIHDVTGSTSTTQTVTISGNGTVQGTAAGYYNQGSTVNLTNNQSDLTFKGLVPSSYKILIEGTSDFGKTTFVSPTGTLAFDIASASSISSTGTYSAVLDDIPSSNISSTRSGTFGAYDWTLQLASGSSDKWDLVISNTLPTLSSSTPSDNATSVAVDSNIILNFSESVDAETGNITIKKTSDDSTVETIDVAGAKVSGSGSSQITVNPSTTLDSLTEYYVLIDATAFDDSPIAALMQELAQQLL